MFYVISQKIWEICTPFKPIKLLILLQADDKAMIKENLSHAHSFLQDFPPTNLSQKLCAPLFA